jgi:hypothetical protein
MTDTALEPALRSVIERVDTVRRRLVVSSVLRWVALLLGVILVYVVAYAWLDHRFHFGPVSRLAALALLFAGAVFWGVCFARSLRNHFSLEHAARFIEDRATCRQQLLATVEYHDQRKDYPYSEALANFMVRQVARQSKGVDWARLVPRWPRTLSISLTLVGSLAAVWMAASNGTYFAHYLARLAQPTSEITPLPANTLTLHSKDIVAAVKSSFELAAAIDGTVPERAALVLSEVEPDTNDTTPLRRIEISPSEGETGKPRLALLTQLPLGEYRYRFESGEVRSGEGTIRVLPKPDLKAITARVIPPAVLGADSYDEVIEGGVLNVIEGAAVELLLTATVPLASGTVQSGQEVTQLVAEAGGKQLAHGFDAAEPLSLNFALTSAAGLTNDELPPLAVVLTQDEAPAFEYTSPGADYLATNVASIPLEMTVRDDFGLVSAELVLEIDERPPLRFPATVAKGDASATLHHVLELEEYDLSVGDTILVYAEAKEVDSGLKQDASPVQSDINFIEIRAYNQIFHQAEESMPSSLNTPKGLQGERLPKLIQVLEYTRAIMKKTWSLKNADPLKKEEKRKAEGVASDSIFIAGKLRKIREAFRRNFSEEQLDDMCTGTEKLLESSNAMQKEDISGALEPTKTAYRLMRKLVEELEKGELAPGGGSTMAELDSIKLEEAVHLTRFEDEQIQWELKKLAEDLDSIREKQKELGQRFERFLLSQNQQEGHRQKITDEESTVQSRRYPDSDEDPSEDDASGSGGTASRTTKEGALLAAPPGGQGQQSAPPEDVLEMLQAAQDALNLRAEALEERLNEFGRDSQNTADAGNSSPLPLQIGNAGRDDSRENNQKNRSAARDAAGEIAEARRAMDALNKITAASYYQTESPESAEKAAQEALADISTALESSSTSLEGIINRNS